MDFIKLLNYNSNNKDYVKYLFFFFVVYIFIFKFENIFTFRQILVLTIAILLTYIFINNNIRKDFDKYKQIDNITSKLNISKYKYIQKDLEIMNSMYKLLYLRSLNSYSYEKTISNINKFLRNYYKIVNISVIFPKKNLYSNLVLLKKNILNELMSITISFKIKKKVMKDENIIYEKKKILDEIGNLDLIINNYIINAKNKINSEWDDNKTTIFSNNITEIYPESNCTQDHFFHKSYSIY